VKFFLCENSAFILREKAREDMTRYTCVAEYNILTIMAKQRIYYPESFRQFPLKPSVKALWGETS
jgi:hypothetical protein